MFGEGVEYARAEVTRGSADTDDPIGVGNHCEDEFDGDHDDEERYSLEIGVVPADDNEAKADASRMAQAKRYRTTHITSCQ
jgi:hypothetical protein